LGVVKGFDIPGKNIGKLRQSVSRKNGETGDPKIQDFRGRRSPGNSDWTVPIRCAGITPYIIYGFIGRAKTSLFYE
jgi:hypothetical protein